MKSLNDLLRVQLSEQEVELYLALLKLGKTKVTAIAKQTGINRSVVYFHLRHLQEKGYIRESRSGTIKQFAATPPSDIAKKLQEWSSSFATAVPSLERLGHPDPQMPVIEIFESRKGFLRIYEEVAALEPGSILRMLEGRRALAGELSLLTQPEWQRFFEKMIEKRIETKALFTSATQTIPQAKLSKQNHALLTKRIWHLRLIEEVRLPFDELLIIYGHKIAFLFPDDALVITLEHGGISKAHKAMFDTLFQLGSPVKDGWR